MTNEIWLKNLRFRGGRREEGSGWGTHVYLWRIHFDVWQNQYNIVKFKNKIKFKKKKNKKSMLYQNVLVNKFTNQEISVV